MGDKLEEFPGLVFNFFRFKENHPGFFGKVFRKRGSVLLRMVESGDPDRLQWSQASLGLGTEFANGFDLIIKELNPHWHRVRH